jgi:cyclic lactone autoinducer peptide
MKKSSVFAVLTTLLTIVAAAFAGSASFTVLHQPETPKALRK